MIGIENIAAKLFEKIKSRTESVTLKDANAKDTQDEKLARSFSFNFADQAGNNFGNVTINLDEKESKIRVTYGQNITAKLDELQKSEWYNFLRDIRMFAKRNLLQFSPHDIAKPEIALKDLQQQAISKKPKDTLDLNSVTESKAYGTTKKSYYQISPETRLVVFHTSSVDETKMGARARHIQKIYVENSLGERRIVTPILSAAKALGRHVDEGGSVDDDFGKHITNLAEEGHDLRRFSGITRNKTFEDGEASEIVSAAHDRRQFIHHVLRKLHTPTGYRKYSEEWQNNAESLNDDIDMDEASKKFTQAYLDPRIKTGLPYAVKAYHASKRDRMNAIEPHLNNFTEWVESVTEDGPKNLVDDDVKMDKLIELMSEPLEAGVDGLNAVPALQNILGSHANTDKLYSIIVKSSEGSSEIDVRPVVVRWLKYHQANEVAEKIQASLEAGADSEPEQQPEEPETPPAPPPPQPDPNAAGAAPPAPAADPNAAPPGMPPAADPNAAPPMPPAADPNAAPPMPPAADPNAAPQESADSLSAIRRLAGLK
jgi:hypothetical protein